MLLLFQHDLDVLVGCLANVLGASGGSEWREKHVLQIMKMKVAQRHERDESPFVLQYICGSTWLIQLCQLARLAEEISEKEERYQDADHESGNNGNTMRREHSGR